MKTFLKWFFGQSAYVVMIGLTALGVFAWWLVFSFLASGYEYETVDYINLFPEGSESKNYRLEADITAGNVMDGLGTRHKYYITLAYWPNGGLLRFKDHCVVYENERGDCSSVDGVRYRVDMHEPIEDPEE